MVENEDKIGKDLPIQLLWTGGWDSTFRLIELSREPVVVQPVYLYGDGRKSMDCENSAMQEILDTLLNRLETQAEILPVKKVDISTIPQNQEITQAYQKIISKHKLGSQYEWIARYAAINPGLELGVEKPHENGIGYMQKVIESEGVLVATGDIHRYRVETRSKDCDLVLSNVYFPLMNTTEQEMLRKVHKWEYKDVMNHIWFCHLPINGKPCGMCRPCCEKVESEMGFLLGGRAIKRNKIFGLLGGGKISRAYGRLVRKFVASIEGE